MSKWRQIEDKNNLVKVYANDRGDIKVIYPKAPKWAQKVALAIYRDLQRGGVPTEKGISEIVKGLWAKMIAEAAKGK